MWATLIPTLARPRIAEAQETPRESPAVRLLKSGKIPPDRLGTVIAIIGRQGNAADLAVLLEKSVDPKGLPREIRIKALETLSDAAANRKVLPAGDSSSIVGILPQPGEPADADVIRAALRAIVLWDIKAAAEPLSALSIAPKTPRDIRIECMSALAKIGGDKGRDTLVRLAEQEDAPESRIPALAALSETNPEIAAPIVAKLWSGKAVPSPADIRSVLNGFLARNTGPDALAKAIDQSRPSEDTAKLVLRQLYAIGRSDASLVSALSAAAGIAEDLAPPTDAEIKALMAEVAEKGDAKRGEKVFRNEANSCLKCHAIRGAGGQIGPELSDIGGVSPVDFLIVSVMVPEAAVKEQHQMMTALTTDGRILQGIIVDESGESIRLKDADGKEFAIPAAEIEERKTGGSLMPKGLPKLMTRQEFVDLIRFLSELGKPGHYQRSTEATVQRWRVLNRPPAELNSPAPDNQIIQTVLNAPEPAWTTVYSHFDGTLPLEEILDKFETAPETIFLQGEIEVTGRGQSRLDVGKSDGVTAWLNDSPINLSAGIAPARKPGEEPKKDEISTQTAKALGQLLLPIGRQKVTLRIDREKFGRKELRARFAPVEFGQAILTVIGGK
jgi:putative heme-binding domain-containing protein